jgi:hypothetical protein
VPASLDYIRQYRRATSVSCHSIFLLCNYRITYITFLSHDISLHSILQGTSAFVAPYPSFHTQKHSLTHSQNKKPLHGFALRKKSTPNPSNTFTHKYGHTRAHLSLSKNALLSVSISLSPPPLSTSPSHSLACLLPCPVLLSLCHLSLSSHIPVAVKDRFSSSTMKSVNCSFHL